MSDHAPGILRTRVALKVKRNWLASFLFRFFRPNDARAAAVNANALILTLASTSRAIPLGDIETAEVEHGRYWGAMRVGCASWTALVSGLTKGDTAALADALEAARTHWWQDAIAARTELLQSVNERLTSLSSPPRYVRHSVFQKLKKDAESAVEGFSARWPDSLSSAPEFQMLSRIQAFLRASDSLREGANETFVANELNSCQEFFDRVEAQPLSDEQRKAVVIDEDRNLVIAAAGSGKTSVIVAKAGWLIRQKYCLPKELLLLTYARGTREDLEKRIRGRLGDKALRGLTVRTFHSLGMMIIGEAEDKRPAVAKVAEDEKALLAQLRGFVADLLEDDGTLSTTMRRWFQEFFSPYRSQHEFKNWGEYWNYIRSHEIRSLKGDKVKSFEECEIANFLYLNGVSYEYEVRYEHPTATSQRGPYHPDFYLPDAGIYIEHFALNASGGTPPFIDRRRYLRDMEWKRRLHAEHGTTLIETFSHEKAAGKLTENLSEKLAAHGVTLSPIPSDQVFDALQELNRVDPFTHLLATFLHHYKGARLSFRDVARRAAESGDRFRAQAFLAVFEPIYSRYQEALSRDDQIDFHDMINRATKNVEVGLYRSPFGYILVDEFQDISPGRARLVKALLDQSPDAQLFAVGDDWQSIFRFAGSDIAIMRKFRDYFGHTKQTYLETTFRCADRIAEVATEFVLSNPAQIEKRVRSTRRAGGPCVHVGLEAEDLPLLGEALDMIGADAATHGEKSTVLLLGRYRHTRPQDMSELSKRHPELELTDMTVHGSKGLEADYVVVLGLRSGKHGFPTEMADDPLLDLVLAAPETHPHAEERRLFYVAMTRARRAVFLLADGDRSSSFVQELIDGSYDITVFGRLPEDDVSCPVCVTGRLRRKPRSGGSYFRCSNWPQCAHARSACPACRQGLPVREDGKCRCPDCGQEIEACPRCDGCLESKPGKFGRFLGCSNWPTCNYKRNLKQ